ncbi:MAG: conserved hypothetical protein, membrane [Candidatus Syntrophoarchaeum caldarius]|uniref:Uncharacterized protein n=1 Tax=Candidatus Syntropharchaeum caldarium TaxID=1838285 RepID=A0A1F2PBN4_9EURY|nr:MAG: conserved hypothetical protein, membrane [Candidatus Syntrophoarchaeum caldarius]
MKKQKLYENGLENYPKPTVVLTNVLLLLWFGFAAYGMSALRFVGLPIISIIYLLFAFLMLGFVLRKHLCTHCYYYGKFCGTGWGKLSSCLFKEKSGNYELGMKMAGLTWGLLTIVPIIAIPLAIYLHREFLIPGGISLTGFMVIMAANQLGRKKGMRAV